MRVVNSTMESSPFTYIIYNWNLVYQTSRFSRSQCKKLQHHKLWNKEGGRENVNSKDFLTNLLNMSNQDLANYIHENGKIKEPTCYDLPWDYVIPDDEEEESLHSTVSF